MIDKNMSIIRVVDDKLCINGKVFEHNELQESKEYLQSINTEEACFYPENEEEVDKLHKIIIRMGERDDDYRNDCYAKYP